MMRQQKKISISWYRMIDIHANDEHISTTSYTNGHHIQIAYLVRLVTHCAWTNKYILNYLADT